MKINKKQLTAGIILVFVGLWGGAWLTTIFPFPTAFNFASLITGMLTTFAGIFIACDSFKID